MEYRKEKISHFTQLRAWKQSHVLVLLIYKTTSLFPSDEKYGLTSQLRRASVSITSNIAEGFGRRSAADKAHFYTMSAGSLSEVQSQVITSRDLGYMQEQASKAISQQITICHKIINGLISSTKAS